MTLEGSQHSMIAKAGEFLGVLLFATLVGTLVGLSRSPILAPSIAGLIAITDRAIQGVLAMKAGQPPPVLISKHWLLPISLGALLGVFGGMVVRTNDLLTHPRNLHAYFRQSGFTVEQTNLLMSRLASTGKPLELQTARTGAGSFLLTSGDDASDTPARLVSREAALRIASARSHSDTEILKELEDGGSVDLKAAIRDLQSRIPTITPTQLLNDLLRP